MPRDSAAADPPASYLVGTAAAFPLFFGDRTKPINQLPFSPSAKFPKSGSSCESRVKLRSMSDRFEGSCLCGAVRFVATGQPESVVWCHCESCRKHSGAPVSVFVAFKRDAYVVDEGQITKFNSSPGRWRGFCAKCGSTLTCEGERSNETHFHVGAFRDATQFQPTKHIFPEERLPWLHLGG